MKEEIKDTKNPAIWGEQVTHMNDPEFIQLFGDILKSGDPIIAKYNDSVDLYNETMADDQVISTWNQRKRKTLAAPMTIEAGGDGPLDIKCADHFRENIARLKMDTITDQMLNGIFFGYMPCEIIWQAVGGKIEIKDLKPRKPERFVFDVENNLRVLTKAQPYKGEELGRYYLWHLSAGAISADNPYGLGLGYYLYWLTRFKKSGLKFWLKFLERFAQPAVLGRFHTGADKSEVDKLLNTIEALATDYGAVIPEDMSLEMFEASRSGTADYKTLREVINSAISKIVVGQTMTTDDGSSRSQSEVHKTVIMDIAKSDSDLFCEAFNETVATYFAEINYPGAMPPKMVRDVEPKQTLKDQAESDKAIGELGYEMEEEAFKEKYGDHWVKKEVPAPLQGVTGIHAPEDEDVKSFAAVAFPDQDNVDILLDTFLSEDMADLSEDILIDVMEFAATHTPLETLEALPELLPATKLGDFEDALGQVFIAAATTGRINA